MVDVVAMYRGYIYIYISVVDVVVMYSGYSYRWLMLLLYTADIHIGG